MKSEIRGLKAGIYRSKDDTLILKVSRKDKGVILEIGDLDADMFYEVTLNEEDKAEFRWGTITPSLDNKKEDNNGKS